MAAKHEQRRFVVFVPVFHPSNDRAVAKELVFVRRGQPGWKPAKQPHQKAASREGILRALAYRWRDCFA